MRRTTLTSAAAEGPAGSSLIAGELGRERHWLYSVSESWGCGRDAGPVVVMDARLSIDTPGLVE